MKGGECLEFDDLFVWVEGARCVYAHVYVRQDVHLCVCIHAEGSGIHVDVIMCVDIHTHKVRGWERRVHPK